jgi:hypothetical protein
MPGMCLLYLVTGLPGLPGSIARYCPLVCREVQVAEIDVTVRALCDQVDTAQTATRHTPQLFYRPWDVSRVQFVRQAMAHAALHRPMLIIVGHAHFAEWMA